MYIYIYTYICSGEVLGPYAGVLCTESSFAKQYSFVPEMFARDAYSYRSVKRTDTLTVPTHTC